MQQTSMKKAGMILSTVTLSLVLGVSVYAVGSGGGGSVKPSDPEPVNSTNSTSTTNNNNSTTSTDTTTTNTTTSTELQATTTTTEPVIIDSNTNSNTNTTPIVNETNECTKDVWACDDWSACDIYGNEERICTLIEDCVTDTSSVEPDSHQPCTTLQCGNKTDLRERVACRLNLTPLAMARELDIQYLPEECRAMADSYEQTTCIERYRSYQPCWGFTGTAERVSCAKGILGLQENVADDIAACTSQECLVDLQDRVYQLIKFRFYELEERSEELAERGANLDDVADFIVLIINKKSEFNSATTTEQRSQAIIDVRDGWHTFLTKVTPDIQ